MGRGTCPLGGSVARLPLIVEAEAEEDLAEAAHWYEQQRKGLGREFLKTVGTTLEQIRRMPLIPGKVFEDVRRLPAGRFPYGVFYQVDATQISVIAVYHNSRDPRGWQDRA